jgi:hypothetical protein
MPLHGLSATDSVAKSGNGTGRARRPAWRVGFGHERHDAVEHNLYASRLGALKTAGRRALESDEARLSPLSHRHVHMLGHYSFTLAEQVSRGQLRPLKQLAEWEDGLTIHFVSLDFRPPSGWPAPIKMASTTFVQIARARYVRICKASSSPSPSILSQRGC